MEKKKNSLIIGRHPLEEALQSGKSIEKVFLNKAQAIDFQKGLCKELKKEGIPFYFLDIERLNRMSGGNHQGVIATISPIEFQPLDELINRCYEKGETPLFIVLDQVTDVRNFGAICRSAEGFGAHGVIIPARGSAALNEEAIKASSGALLRIPLVRSKRIIESLDSLKNNGIKIMAALGDTGLPIFEAPLDEPVALLLGSEGEGINRALMSKADMEIGIPMPGEFDSYNVSVASGIILYEVVRQRMLS